MSFERSLNTYSALNIFKNGAFETGDTDYWGISGAGEGGFSPFDIIITDEVDSPDGCLNYGRTYLPAMEPLVIEQSLLAQLGEYTDLVEGETRFDYVQGLNPSDFSVFGCPLTIGVSIRVIGGTAALFAAVHTIDTVTSEEKTTLIAMEQKASSPSWKRYTAVFDGEAVANQTLRVVGMGVHIERRDGSPEINIGKFQLVEGFYTVIPYTPCMASLAFPKNAIVLGLGRETPPGYEPIYEDERFYIKSGTPGETGGSDHHEHVILQTMSDHTNTEGDDDWYKRAFLADKNVVSKNVVIGDEQVQIDDGRVAHQHTIESPGGSTTDNTSPLWKGFLLCRKK